MIVYDQTHRKRMEDKRTAKNLSHPLKARAILSAMNPPPSSFEFLIETAQIIVAAVNTRDNLHLRPEVARKAVAVRLASGLRLLRAFLRRLIILMAVELEWTLVDTRGPMKRPHGRPSKPTLASFSIKGLDAPIASPWLDGYGPQFKPVIRTGRVGPVDVDMSNLYAQLKFLSRIAANPMAKAQRLAFHLARTYEGIIIPPDGPKRIAGRWGTQVSAFYAAMRSSIITQSRNRPPPLPPPRNIWPSVTAL
jgi:hypothetical protein